MKRFVPVLLVVFVCGIALGGGSGSAPSSNANCREPENHTLVVNRLLLYHDSGEYDRQIREVANSARDFLAARVKDAHKDDKLAAVFDIDETSVSNWEALADCGFCSFTVQGKLYSIARDPAIVPVLELFNFAKSKGVAVFFLTGRPEAARAATIKNLTEVGYSGWADLITRTDASKQEPARIFKSHERQLLTDKGYRIVLNIGDQASDLAGCCAERTFKLPNPFYLIE
jgi:predicted secreted acid phosphatase